MTDQIREQVSALLDGELSRDEIGLLIRRMERDPELRGSFGRYSLIGEALRAPGGAIARPSFAARVSAAIDEPASAVADDLPSSPPTRSFWRHPAVATAVAASFAAGAVLVLRPEWLDTQPQSDGRPRLSIVASNASPTPAQSQRLAGYLVAHSQFSSPIARRNVWSGLLAADPGLQRVSYDVAEAP